VLTYDLPLENSFPNYQATSYHLQVYIVTDSDINKTGLFTSRLTIDVFETASSLTFRFVSAPGRCM